MQFPPALATSVSVTHESRKKDMASNEQKGFCRGTGKIFACFDLSKGTDLSVSFDD